VSWRASDRRSFQQPNPFPESIYENRTSVPHQRLHGRNMDDRLVGQSSLRKAFIWDETKHQIKEKRSNSLSGGQQQRLCIAGDCDSKPEVDSDGLNRVGLLIRSPTEDRKN